MRQSVLQRSDLYDLSSIDGLLLSSVPSCENPSGYPGSSTYLFSDPEGVRITFNSSGAITSGASYNPYGQLTAGGVSSVTPFGYGGGYTDPTGLIYFVNRYYDPSTGQFISVDPLVGITDQPYQYVGSDPVNGSDPLGLCNPFGNCLSEAWHDTAHGFDVARHAIAHYADNTGHFVRRDLCNRFIQSGSPLGGLIGCKQLSSTQGLACSGIAGTVYPNFEDPSQAPGPGWEWKGTGHPGSNEGAWFNPDTGQSLHPDFNHPGDVPPHYDYTVRGSNNEDIRIYPGEGVPESPLIPQIPSIEDFPVE